MEVGAVNTQLHIKIDPSGAVVGGKVVGNALDSIDRKSKRTQNTLGMLKRALRLAGIASAGLFAKSSAQDAIAYDKKLREVSTLVDTTTFNFAKLTDEMNRQAVAFGSMPVTQLEATYSIISSGAQSAARATEILTASNKLAVGGATSVALAADGLTSVLNAYGDASGGVAHTSDVFFEAMKAGKTTIEQLSHSIGLVTPSAYNAGIAIEELFSSVATLTKFGVRTNIATTQLRAAISNIIKPSSQAADMAKKLGVEFSGAALKAAGSLQVFLRTMYEAADGDSAKLSKMFGSVEGLNAVLTLAGDRGSKEMARITKVMEEATTSTTEAFEKMKGSAFAFESGAALVKLQMIKLGTVIIDTLTPAILWVINNFDQFKKMIVVVSAGLAALYIQLKVSAAITAVYATEAYAASAGTKLFGINAGKSAVLMQLFTGKVKQARIAVQLFTLSLLRNPLGILFVALAVGITYMTKFEESIYPASDAIATLGDYAAVTWDLIVQGIKSVTDIIDLTLMVSLHGLYDFMGGLGDTFSATWTIIKLSMAEIASDTISYINKFIGAFVGLDAAILLIFRNFPASMKDIAIQALNGAINIVNAGIKKIAELMNVILPQAYEIDVSKIGLDLIENHFEGSAKNTFDKVKQVFNQKMEVNYLANAEQYTKDTVSGMLDSASDSISSFHGKIQKLAQERAYQRMDWVSATPAEDEDSTIVEKHAKIEQSKLTETEAMFAGMKAAGEDYYKSNSDLVSNYQGVATRAFKSMEDALVNFVQTGKLNFKDFASSVIADLIRIKVQKFILDSLGLGTPGGGSTPAPGPNARAQGGPVISGQTYLVGEKGPEYFKPTSSQVIAKTQVMPTQPTRMNESLSAPQPLQRDHLRAAYAETLNSERSQSGYIVGSNGPEYFKPSVAGSIIPNHALSSISNQTVQSLPAYSKERNKALFSTDTGAIASFKPSLNKDITQSILQTQGFLKPQSLTADTVSSASKSHELHSSVFTTPRYFVTHAGSKKYNNNSSQSIIQNQRLPDRSTPTQQVTAASGYHSEGNQQSFYSTTNTKRTDIPHYVKQNFSHTTAQDQAVTLQEKTVSGLLQPVPAQVDRSVQDINSYTVNNNTSDLVNQNYKRSTVSNSTLIDDSKSTSQVVSKTLTEKEYQPLRHILKYVIGSTKNNTNNYGSSKSFEQYFTENINPSIPKDYNIPKPLTSTQKVLQVAGYRASGGPVASGSTYVVGERGPEYFKPNVSGSIIPNHALSNASKKQTQSVSNVKININNNASQAKASATATPDGSGGFNIDVLVESIADKIGQSTAKGDGLASILEGRYGLNPAAGMS